MTVKYLRGLMTKRSEPLTVDRISEAGTNPPLPPILEHIALNDRPEAIVFLLEEATLDGAHLGKSNQILLKGFFFGEGQQEVRFAKIVEELRKAGLNANKTTPKNRLVPALEAFARYSGSPHAADLLASRFVSEQSGVDSDEGAGAGKPSQGFVRIAALPPQAMHGLSGVATTAKASIDFCGITAGGSVGTDSFRDALRTSASANIAFRFLLLHPACDAFERRAEEEEEPPEAWRLTLFATLHRLSTYRQTIDADVSVRLISSDPVWRLMIVDRETVYVNSYLPRKRGTESTQYVIPPDLSELTSGFCSYFSTLWENGVAVGLDGDDGPDVPGT
ncbi:MAG TPA: hypothetical protein VGO66_01480 [Solirubrobacterales bacterium]|nr:hypothetical protein [Solirubrobacterales bacterium]